MHSRFLKILLFSLVATTGAFAQYVPGTDIYLPVTQPEPGLWNFFRSQCAFISDPRPAPSGNFYENYIMLEGFDRSGATLYDSRRATFVTSNGVVQNFSLPSTFGESGNMIMSRSGQQIAYTKDYGRQFVYSHDYGQTFNSIAFPGVPGYQGTIPGLIVTGTHLVDSYVFGNMAFDDAGNLYVFYLRIRDNVQNGQSQNTAKLFGAVVGADGSVVIPPVLLADIDATFPTSAILNPPGPMLTTVATENHIVFGMNVGPGYNDGVSPPRPNEGMFIVVDTRNLNVQKISWGGSQQRHYLGGTDFLATVASTSMVSDGRSIFLLTLTGDPYTSQQLRYRIRQFSPSAQNATTFFPNTAPVGADPYMDLDDPSIPAGIEVESVLGLPVRPPAPPSAMLGGEFWLYSMAAPWYSATKPGNEVVLLAKVKDYNSPIGAYTYFKRGTVTNLNSSNPTIVVEDAMDITNEQINAAFPSLAALETFDLSGFFQLSLIPSSHINAFGSDTVTSFCRMIEGNVGTTPFSAYMFGLDIK